MTGSKRRERLNGSTTHKATGKAIQAARAAAPMIFTDNGYMPPERAYNDLVKAQQSGGNVAQFMSLGSYSTPPVRGTRELLELYSQSPWLRAITNKIAVATAETDWVLYAAKSKDRAKYVMHKDVVSPLGNIREAEFKRQLDVGEMDQIDQNHPLLKFLANGTGNPRMLGFPCLVVTQVHLDMVGEAFWLLESDESGMPIAYWPLPPSWITDFPTEDRPYYDLNVPGGVRTRIPSKMIVPFIHANPANPYKRGSGIAGALSDEIQIDEYAAKHQKAFFLNRARPDIIVSGQFISPKDSERLEKQWLQEHQGFWKAFKPLFFSQKVDVKELTQSFESMQMVQVRKHERDTFISVFGVPPEKFGIIGESKRSTIAAADYFWNKDVIRPRVELIRRVLQSSIVPLYDERLLLYYDTPVIQDDEFQLNSMHKMPETATINEWRKVQGLPSLGIAGEALFVPLNKQIVATTDQAGKPLTQLAQPEKTEEQKALLAASGGELDNAMLVSEISNAVLDGIVSQIGKALIKQDA